MGVISIREARGLFTKQLSTVYKERVQVKGFLRSFFADKESATSTVSIEVQRGTEKVAADILRGTEGNLNIFSKSTEKIFEPYLYDEKFNATQLDIYDQLHLATSGNVDSAQFDNWLSVVSEKIGTCQDKIERAYELKCAQVFEDGIIQSDSATNIDFKRKAGSKVDLTAGSYWTDAIDPMDSIIAGCEFLRAKGKVQGGVFDLIMGTEAATALMDNAKFKAKADIKDFNLITANMSQQNSLGAVPGVSFQAGSYQVRTWTYPEVYDLSGVSTAYVNPKKVVLLPEAPKFTFEYAAVPVVLSEVNAVANVKGQFHTYEYLDPAKTAHYYGVKSAGIPVPVGVDMIYTIQVVAS